MYAITLVLIVLVRNMTPATLVLQAVFGTPIFVFAIPKATKTKRDNVFKVPNKAFNH